MRDLNFARFRQLSPSIGRFLPARLSGTVSGSARASTVRTSSHPRSSPECCQKRRRHSPGPYSHRRRPQSSWPPDRQDVDRDTGQFLIERHILDRDILRGRKAWRLVVQVDDIVLDAVEGRAQQRFVVVAVAMEPSWRGNDSACQSLGRFIRAPEDATERRLAVSARWLPNFSSPEGPDARRY